MPKSENKQETAWRLVAENSPLLVEVEKQGYFVVKAEDLKLWGNREPRLMAKLDSLSDRPAVFKQNSLNMLPLDRGTYVVFRDTDNKCYFKMPDSYDKSVVNVFRPPPDLLHLDTLSQSLCSGESEAVDLAFHSLLLGSFCGGAGLRLTRRGRFGSGFFPLTLPGSTHAPRIQNAQIEVDSVFEGDDAILLIEAKIGFRADFHIRQLHYPYMWLKTRSHKPVHPILLCYSNGEFQLSEFELSNVFGDVRLVRQEYFVIDEPAVTPIRLEHILRWAPSAVEDMDIPFPQADDLDKVIDTVRAVQDGVTQTDELVSKFGYVERQAGYYVNAARYLGFLTPGKQPAATMVGHRLVTERNRVNRTEMVLKGIVARPALREAVVLLKNCSFKPENVAQGDLKLLIAVARPDIAGDTINRRAVTVHNWLRWLVRNCDFDA